MSSAISDLKNPKIPPALYWNNEKVVQWLCEELGLSQYQECFEKNKIDGKKLIHVTASHLPDIGVTDFQHIKTITKAIRELMSLEEPFWNRSISIPPRNDLGLYLEMKSVTGQQADNLTYEQFMNTYNEETLWQPPLNNHCQLLPTS